MPHLPLIRQKMNVVLSLRLRAPKYLYCLEFVKNWQKFNSVLVHLFF